MRFVLQRAAWDLNGLLTTLDPGAELAQRNLWWVRLVEWLRHAPLKREGVDAPQPGTRTPLPVLRLRHLLQLLDRQPEYRARMVEQIARTLADLDATLLLADFGFAQRFAFFSELGERLQRRLLPGTAETRDLAELFQLVFSEEQDAAWLDAIDTPTLEKLGTLLHESVAASRHPGAAAGWRSALLDAQLFCISQVGAAAFSAEIRTRLSAPAQALTPFRQLGPAFEEVRRRIEDPAASPADLTPALGYARALLDACRRDAQTVHEHLEEHGVSIDIVFTLEQLQSRLDRIDHLLDCLLSDRPAEAVRRLVVQFAESAEQRRSVAALLARNYSLLARKVTERSAETGEHYITRTPREYASMFWRACGGGAVTALTVFLKFLIGSLGLSAFWGGFAAGLNYAASFVAIQLAHFTLATKQPAMTAPAMAARLRDLSSDEAIEGFVDEVAHLMRTQVAGILGNVAVVLPCVLVVQLLWQAAFGEPLVSAAKARYALDSLDGLGFTPLYAAATGVLLFASSLVAGWAENWFVLHRLGSALRWNPRIVARLGEARAARWSAQLQGNISGFAGNISLGLMLGLVPAVAAFFGVNFDVRHVTLASGQLGAALGALGWELVYTPGFWLAVLGIALTGVLNVTVSFALAFRLALRSRNIRLKDRHRLNAALRRRLRRHPLGFLLPLRGRARAEPAA
ncbi:site-specific recombinase [Aquabacterium sp. A7-Y]|uniref:site-specific recombinase n=1 Tax=Aquabacterium sp. A7-Y TaxID=1349605 RepID=UPI00223E422E|nr:site-specific recombinase [Aquabacterium sp. A7-Y]MCW7539512.1 site-specific recombinase [Aquabacterium sp. A7-Y]